MNIKNGCFFHSSDCELRLNEIKLQWWPFSSLRCYCCFVKKYKRYLEVYWAGLQGNVLLFCFLSLTRSLRCCRPLKDTLTRSQSIWHVFTKENSVFAEMWNGPCPLFTFYTLGPCCTLTWQSAERWCAERSLPPPTDLLKIDGSSNEAPVGASSFFSHFSLIYSSLVRL